jgi:hypothetical protein
VEGIQNTTVIGEKSVKYVIKSQKSGYPTVYGASGSKLARMFFNSDVQIDYYIPTVLYIWRIFFSRVEK